MKNVREKRRVTAITIRSRSSIYGERLPHIHLHYAYMQDSVINEIVCADVVSLNDYSGERKTCRFKFCEF